MTVKTAESRVTLFTPDTNEHHLHPQVKLADQVLTLEKKPNVFGVTFDTHLTFTLHCNNIAVKGQQLNNSLRALAGSTWGCNKETLLTTYHTIDALCSSTADPSGRNRLRTITVAGFNGHKIRC